MMKSFNNLPGIEVLSREMLKHITGGCPLVDCLPNQHCNACTSSCFMDDMNPSGPGFGCDPGYRCASLPCDSVYLPMCPDWGAYANYQTCVAA